MILDSGSWFVVAVVVWGVIALWLPYRRGIKDAAYMHRMGISDGRDQAMGEMRAKYLRGRDNYLTYHANRLSAETSEAVGKAFKFMDAVIGVEVPDEGKGRKLE